MLSLKGKSKEGEGNGVQGVVWEGKGDCIKVPSGILCPPVGIKRLGPRGHVSTLSVGKSLSAAGRDRKSALCLL